MASSIHTKHLFLNTLCLGFNKALDKREYLMIIRDHFCQFCIKSYVVTPNPDGSDEVSQHKVSMRKKKSYPQLSSNNPSYLELWFKQELYSR